MNGRQNHNILLELRSERLKQKRIPYHYDVFIRTHASNIRYVV